MWNEEKGRRMAALPKRVRLKDGNLLLLRPMLPEDLDSSHRFFLALPEEDRLHLRLDVTDRENVRIRMESTDALEAWRLVALQDEEIVGDATLYQPRYGWMRHTGEIRCIVARPWQGRGLGTFLLNELFQAALRRGVERLFAQVSTGQAAALHILDQLGFRREAVLRKHRRDLRGEAHDVIVMTASLSDLWRRLEDLMHAMDGHGREWH